MHLSEKILYCRRKAALSQEALAERLGVSRQAVSKWETGEAVPEVGKLLQMARTFGVTTDWLLSEEEAESAPQESAPPEPAPPEPPAPEAPAAAHSWVNDVPGVIGRALQKYGWLFGVRIAIGGGAVLLFSLLVMLVSNAFFSGASDMMASPFGGSAGMNAEQWYDEAGNPVDVSVPSSLAQSMTGGSMFDSFERTGRNVFGTVAGFLAVVGAVMLIGGVVLAVELKKLGQGANRT